MISLDFSHEQAMTNSPKPDLSDHEEEAAPFDDVLRTLLSAKPAPRSAPDNQAPKDTAKSDSP